jgi:hypothetical protein
MKLIHTGLARVSRHWGTGVYHCFLLTEKLWILLEKTKIFVDYGGEVFQTPIGPALNLLSEIICWLLHLFSQ